MRPLRLTLRGFRSHTETTITFEDRSLVGIVGPTGSGKSSVLDGIAFALYGSTPAAGKESSKLINSRATEAQVELFVEVSGVVFRLARVIKRKGPAQQVLERWSALDGEKLETLSDKSREINAHVERLIGLDFSAFTRSVMLAQGRFAELLTATPAEAASVLTALFGFGIIERMRGIVRDRKAQVAAELALVAAAKKSLSTKVVQLEEKQAEVAALERRGSELASLVERVGAVEQEQKDLLIESSAIAERLAVIEAALERLPPEETRRRHVEEVLLFAERSTEAATQRDEAVAASRLASAALDEAVAAGMQTAIAELAAAVQAESTARKQVDEVERRRDAASRAATAADESLLASRERVLAAESEWGAATVAADSATEALRILQLAHAAHSLAQGVSVGDPCPVCRRTLEDEPGIPTPSGLDEANAAAAAGAETAATAVESLRRARERVAGLEEASSAAGRVLASEEALLGEAKAQHAKELSAVESAVNRVDGKASDPLGSLERARAKWEGLLAARTEAAKVAGAATERVTELEHSNPAASFATALAACVPAAELAGVPVDGVDAGAFLAFVEAILGALTSQRVGMDEGAKATGVRLAQLELDRSGALVSGGLAADSDLSRVVAESTTQLASSRGAVEVLAGQVAAERSALTSEQETAKQALLLDRLHADLAPGKFPQFLLDERRSILADQASGSFRDLSGGRYEFTLEDDRFRIRDRASAGLIRDADTLSGGETFLASLSLALGLANMVAMDDAVLDAFFVDEGFGALDADSLDLAMEGVEALVEDDRLVVVVSHVAELSERIEDLIVLEKDPVTHSTIVIRA